jgi:hypothetical protein
MNGVRICVLVILVASALVPARGAETLRFDAKDANITAAGSIRFEEKPDYRNIGCWDNTNAVVRWQAAEIPKGTYRVLIVYACARENPGSHFEVVVGSQRANFVVTSTGGWTEFKEADLGPIIIRKGGPADVTARVTRIARRWGINLRAIRLVPET